MKLGYSEEIAKDGTYRNVSYAVRKVSAPFIVDHKEYYCVYVESRKDFSEEEIEAFPCSITWNEPYKDTWLKSRLTGQKCLGWDYFEDKEISLEEILKEVRKVINYLARTYEEYGKGK